MHPERRSRPPAPLPMLLPAAAVAASSFADHGPREAALLLGLGSLLLVLAARASTPAARIAAASAALLAAIAGGACLVPGRPSTGRNADAWIVRGRLVAIEHRPRGDLLHLADGRRVRVPRTGIPRLDRLPGDLVPGCVVEVPLREASAGPAPVAPCGRSVRRLADPGAARRVLGWPARIRERFRRHVARRLRGLADDPGAGLAVALVAGDRARLRTETREDLRAAGLAHVAVVSGLHFGLLIAGGLLILGGATGRRHPRRAAVAATLSLLLFTLLPVAPPVVRAGLAVLAASGGELMGRRGDAFGRLGLAGIVLLLGAPGLAGGLSFRLTLAAAWALGAALARGPDRGRALRVAFAPFLATWPFLVRVAGRVSPWAPLANLAAAPLVPALLACGWTAVLAPPWPPDLAQTLGGLTVLLGRVLATLAACVADLPGSGRLAVPAPPLLAVAEECLLAAWLLLPVHRRNARRAAVLLLVLLLARDAGLLPLQGQARVPPGVHVLDVGQGQAVLLAGTKGGLVLVDTGDDRGREGTRALLRSLARLGVRRLETLALSHGDRDHAGGAPLVLRALPVGRVLVPPGLLDAPALRAALRVATARGIPIAPATAGMARAAGSVRIRVVHPPPGTRVDGNETSLVLLARAGGVTALVPGDAGIASEPAWVPRLAGRRVDLLVPGHHGARAATGKRLLAAVAPRLAALSAGRANPHGHPHDETISRLHRVGVRIFSTARSGTLRVHATRGRLAVEGEYPAREPGRVPR